VCTFIGAQAQIDTRRSGGRNPLVELAQAIDITGAPSAAERELDAMRGPRVADSWQDDPRLARVAADPDAGTEASNPSGSYEAFASMFGAPPPPAGDG
jgi:hypothetical protein